MARTVKDAARLLEVITGPDPNDSYTLSSPLRHVPRYSACCKLDGLRGKRVGIARNVLDIEADIIQHIQPAFEQAVGLISRAGATIIDHADFTAYATWKARICNLVTRADFVSNAAQFFANLEHNPQRIHSVADLRDFTRNCAGEEYPQRNVQSWDMALDQGLSNQSPRFQQDYQENMFLGGEGGILGALECHNLDAIILPTVIAYEIPALVGSPVVTVPLGAADAETPVKQVAGWDVVDQAPGVPFGISFLGKKWSEEMLIEMAYAYEQMTATRGMLERAAKTPEWDLASVIDTVAVSRAG
jgi:amidase